LLYTQYPQHYSKILGRVMLGYTYKDIQAFGDSLTWAIDTAKNQGDEQNYKQLLIVWDFFEGLLAEGYIDENTFYG